MESKKDLGQFIVLSIFSSAKVGEPAATNPITGYSLPLFITALFLIEIPREAPLSIVIKSFFSKALRCVSAELGDLNPNSLQISALVGGKPVFLM